MLTIILPGYSSENNLWAQEAKNKLNHQGNIIVHEWEHWKTGKQININEEADKIILKIGREKVNFIAKSIGTKVLMRILPRIYKQVNKIVLCGIPIDPLTYVKGIMLLNRNNILIIQNSHDPYMPYFLIKIYIHLINRNIRVISKESNTHDYPYIEDFERFIFNT
jgi:hypothetical protein